MINETSRSCIHGHYLKWFEIELPILRIIPARVNLFYAKCISGFPASDRKILDFW